jgi:hypothetical protein
MQVVPDLNGLIAGVLLSGLGAGLIVVIVIVVISAMVMKSITGILIRLGPMMFFIVATAFVVFAYYDLLQAKALEIGLVSPSGDSSFINSHLMYIAFAPIVWDLLLGYYIDTPTPMVGWLFGCMFVLGLISVLWFFRSIPSKKLGLGTGAGVYIVWGLGFYHYKIAITLYLFGVISPMIGLFFLTVGVLLGGYLIGKYILRPVEEVVQDCVGPDCPIPGYDYGED